MIKSKNWWLILNADKLVIGLTGMPGAGKSLVIKCVQKSGYAVVSMGDVIREETSKRGLALNSENVGKVMLELRAIGGENVVAEKCIPKIEAKQDSTILIDGIRSYAEVEVFSKHFSKFVLIAVHASPQTRFSRLASRGRSDDPTSLEIFNDRDMREINVGIGKAIALSKYIIINDDTIETLNERAKQVIERAEQK
ncbi:MAG: flagellar hook-basal body complex protein FliE [Crenarchaeota archaeon]|nr:flagellar hook-basal body complex protein FliE [Thermoproteota archaeon]